MDQTDLADLAPREWCISFRAQSPDGIVIGRSLPAGVLTICQTYALFCTQRGTRCLDVCARVQHEHGDRGASVSFDWHTSMSGTRASSWAIWRNWWRPRACERAHAGHVRSSPALGPHHSRAGGGQGWLYQTATHLALNERRRNSVLRFLPFSGAERQPGDYLMRTPPSAHGLRAISSREQRAVTPISQRFSRSEIA